MVISLGRVNAIAGVRPFGHVHRDVGVSQQRSGVLAVVRTQRDADARPDGEGVLFHDERLVECLENLQRDQRGATHVGSR